MNEYSFFLADLLKRNTELHGSALQKQGNYQEWPGKTRIALLKELRLNPTNNGKIKAFSGLVWGQLRKKDITTRQIYGLLLHWALYLSEDDKLVTFTEDYAELLKELKFAIESGAAGEVEDIPPEEILAEWEMMKTYHADLHTICTEWINLKKEA